jgi:formamidopyrimidine-DNA glycosylase
MPELPEVEYMRKILLCLKSPTHADNGRKKRLQIQRVKDNPPRSFLSDEEIESLNESHCTVADVTRKGKLLCLELKCEKAVKVKASSGKGDDKTTTISVKRVYLFLHMGMTGRISSPDNILDLQELKEGATYPPPYTYLTFKVIDQATGETGESVSAEASFSDPRKFGSVELCSSKDRFGELAPDALVEMKGENLEGIIGKLAEQRKAIKAILLDQKYAISGAGNWICDEAMYQMEMHPEQKYLTRAEAKGVIETLSRILETAVASDPNKYPDEWLFNYRWARKQKGAKDYRNRTITFVTSGGRTSAIVALIQKEGGRSKANHDMKKKRERPASKKEETTEEEPKKATHTKQKARLAGKRKAAPADENRSTRKTRKTAMKVEETKEDEPKKATHTTNKKPRLSGKQKTIPANDNGSRRATKKTAVKVEETKEEKPTKATHTTKKHGRIGGKRISAPDNDNGSVRKTKKTSIKGEETKRDVPKEATQATKTRASLGVKRKPTPNDNGSPRKTKKSSHECYGKRRRQGERVRS